MARVANEIRRAANEEKSARKITQQAIADKIGTSRAVINREMSGLENLTARRTAEILWALGWEPHFEARKIEARAGQNDFVEPPKSKVHKIELLPRADTGPKIERFDFGTAA